MSEVTQRQIEFFLGGDNLENSCLIELEALANGSYKPKQFKKDVLKHWADAVFCGDIENEPND